MTDDQWTSASKDLLIAEIHRLQGERNDLARRAAPEAAEPVARLRSEGDGGEVVIDEIYKPLHVGTHEVYAGRAPTDSRAGRDAVEALPGSLQALRAEALEVFDGPETPQDVRDVIEWYSSSIAALVERARNRIDAALSTTAGRAE